MKLSEVLGPYGFAMVVAAMFLIVGLSAAASILWGLLTGGPRDWQKPGSPHLYDRTYYLLSGLALIGWWMAMLSVPAQMVHGLTPQDPIFNGFLVGWGILAIGMGTKLTMRREMMCSGSHYLAKHGFVLFRFFHTAQARQFDRMNTELNFLPWIFLIAGAAVLLVNITRLPEALTQASAGAHVVWDFISRLQFA